jgi:SHS2 domain-containing protein
VKSLVPQGYRYLEHITDAYIEAYGSSLSEAFDHSGRALINLMFDIEKVNGLVPITISVEGTDELELLYNWLERVLLTVLVEGQIMSKFDVRIYSDSMLRLEASSMTESIDMIKHAYKTEVKGITYHAMEVTHDEGMIVTRYIVDL